MNTFTNLGGTWPKYFVLKGRSLSMSSTTFSDGGTKAVDFFSIATCEINDAGSSLTVKGERSRSLPDNEC
jgi:MFS transporter, PAT family, solute carrier family 33 (acetyl-CoA transportor), member 1